jgi:exopolysaccharide biosynthesis polyprenyl glycosylphosphotransferase
VAGRSPAPAGALALNSTLPFPLILQRRAKDAVRRHMARAVYRVVVLLASDIAGLAFVRAAFRLAAEDAWLGTMVAQLARTLVPRGTFPPAQFTTTVVLGLLIMGTYRANDRRRDPRAIVAGAALGLGLVYWNTLWTAFSWPGLLGFALTVVAVATQLTVQRVLLDVAVRWMRPRNDLAARVLIIASADVVPEARNNVAVSDPADFNIIGYLDTNARPARDALGGVDDLVRVIERHAIETVIFYGQLDDATFTRLINLTDAAGCHVFAVPRAFTLPDFRTQLVWHSGEALVQITRPGLRGGHMLLKSAVDFAAALVGLALLSPLMVALAIAVRATSRGPAVFAQERVGQGGRRFRMYKFRSMVHDAEARRVDLVGQSLYCDERLFKIPSDPRITPLGAFLRRSSLDELPQLWNVLRGEMSLVGPRPPLPCEVALYEDHHYHRLDMKPGITGPWQVGGRNRITDFEEVVRLEQSYIRHWSIWKDVAILARTIPAVVRFDGAL